MKVANLEPQSELFSKTHIERKLEPTRLIRTYEQILESELKRVNPILKGHTDAVTGIALTSDNSFLISCGKDNYLREWDLITQVEKSHKIIIESGNITLMALSPDGTFVVLGISDGSIIVHSLQINRVICTVNGNEKNNQKEDESSKENIIQNENEKEIHKELIVSVSISRNCLYFCTADSGKIVKYYDLEGTKRNSKEFEENSLIFSIFAGDYILIGDITGKIAAWRYLSDEVEYFVNDFQSQPSSALFNEEYNYLFIGYSSGEVAILKNIPHENQINRENIINTKKSSAITGISYSNNSKIKSLDMNNSQIKEILVVSNELKELIFIDLRTKKPFKSFIRHSDKITGVLQTNDGKLVISASHDKLIKIWQKGEFREYKSSIKFGSNIKCTSFHKESGVMAIAYEDISVKLINLAEEKEKALLTWKSQGVLAAIWSHDKKQLITSNSTPEISVISYENRRVNSSIPCESPLTCLSLLSDKNILYGCNGQKKILIINLEDKKTSSLESEEANSHYFISFSPDWLKLYSGGDEVIYIWNIITSIIEKKLQGINSSSIRCLVPLSNGKTLISGGNDGKVIFWNLEIEKPDEIIEEGGSWARAMELFNQEKSLVIVHDTSKITVVNIQEKKIEYEFQVGSQYSCKVLNDTTLVMGDSKNIRFWNLKTKIEENVIQAHSDCIFSLLVDQENDILLSFSNDRWIKSWKISDKSQNESFQSYCGTISTIYLNDEVIGIANNEGLVLVYSARDVELKKNFQVHTSFIQSLDFKNGSFATGSNDNSLGIFNINDGKISYFQGHNDWVRCVKFSHDGRYLYSASDDKTVKIWNIEKKSLEFTLKGHEGYVYSLYVFPSGNYLASCSEDKQVKVWNLEKRKEKCSFQNHSSKVIALCLSDDENILFSSSDDTTIAAYDITIEKFICYFTGHSSPIKALAIFNNVLFSTSTEEVKSWLIREKKEVHSFRWDEDIPYHLALSYEKKYLAASFGDGIVRVYDFQKDKFLDVIQPFQSNCPKIAFSKDSNRILIAYPGNKIVVWNIEDQKEEEFPSQKSNSRNVVFSNDFLLLATYSDDFKAYVWDWGTKQILHESEGYQSDSQVMLFSSDNQFLFVGTDDGTVSKWDIKTKDIKKFKEHSQSISGLVLIEKKNLLVSGSHDRKVCFYDLGTNASKTEEKHSDWVRALAITSHEKYVISAGDDRVLIVWDLETKDESFRLSGHSHYIYGLASQKDTDTIYSCSEDKSIIEWSLEKKRLIKYLRTISGNIYCIVITKDGKKAYTGSDGNTVNIFDLERKTEIGCFSGHIRTVCDLALSEDEAFIVSGSWDNSVRVHSTYTYETIAVFEKVHTDYVRSVAITKDNSYVISGSDDKTIIISNISTKNKEFTLEGHMNYVYSIRLFYVQMTHLKEAQDDHANESQFLISASRDETLKLWDIKKKSLEFTFIGHAGAVRCLEIFNNNNAFVSGGEDFLIKAWSIKEQREDFTLKGHSGIVTTLKVTSDNLSLISGSDDTKIIIWDLEQRNVKIRISGNTSNVLALNITHLGNILVTAANDKLLKLWKMSDPKSSDENNTPFVSLKTSDDKHELKYSFGRLRKGVLNEDKLEMGTSDIYDPYYQNLLKFYNLIDNIQEGQFNTLLTTSSEVIFSKFLYTTLHIIANKGNSKALSNICSPNTQLKTDYFGKSPLYYALKQQHPDCVDKLMNFLVYLSELNDITKIQNSFSALQSDLPLIIKNSSKSLHVILRSSLIQTDLAFARIEKELPLYMFNLNYIPITKDFFDDRYSKADKVPVIMKYTPFKIPCKMGSRECIEFLEAIIECSNTGIYNTQLIQYLLQTQWDHLIYWVFGYTFLLWFNLVVLIFLFNEENKIAETWMLPLFLLINFLLIVWETIQMLMQGFRGYFKELWNIVDFFRFLFSILWIVIRILDINNEELRIISWSVALLNFTRGLTGFRLFNGTRYYVRLIVRALKDMGYFIIMLSYSTFTFGVMFKVSRNDDSFKFKSFWMDSYSLNFGNFDAEENYQFSYETITYMLATVINVILMLNLLISILGDSYAKFQEEKVIIDYKEKASVIVEIQKMMFWKKNYNQSNYLHLMCAYGGTEEVLTMDERIETVTVGIRSVSDEVKKNETSNKSFENQLEKFESEVREKIDSVDGKIVALEAKIEEKIEGKFNELNETLKNIVGILKPNLEEKKEKAD